MRKAVVETALSRFELTTTGDRLIALELLKKAVEVAPGLLKKEVEVAPGLADQFAEVAKAGL